MNFRRVGREALDGPRGRRGSLARSSAVAHAGRGRNRETTAAWLAAWVRGDIAALEALSTPDVECRWVGFGDEPLVATGLTEILARSREFERRHGLPGRYTVTEEMLGRQHATLLFQAVDHPPEVEPLAIVAIYRVQRRRIAAITVYADEAG